MATLSTNSIEHFISTLILIPVVFLYDAVTFSMKMLKKEEIGYHCLTPFLMLAFFIVGIYFNVLEFKIEI